MHYKAIETGKLNGTAHTLDQSHVKYGNSARRWWCVCLYVNNCKQIYDRIINGYNEMHFECYFTVSVCVCVFVCFTFYFMVTQICFPFSLFSIPINMGHSAWAGLCVAAVHFFYLLNIRRHSVKSDKLDPEWPPF